MKAKRPRPGRRKAGVPVGRLLSRLTWMDLMDWAGSRTLSRGRSYARQSRVEDLARFSDGLVAWVRGGRRYATSVLIDPVEDPGQISSACTCPVGMDGCKHAVAILCACLEGGITFTDLPLVGDEDARIALIEGECTAVGAGEEERFATPDAGRVEEFLDELPRKQLVQLVVDAASDLPDLADRLEAIRARTSGEPGRLPALVRRELDRLLPDPYELAHGSGSWNPEASAERLRTLLQGLSATRAADELVGLGPELLERANEAVEWADNEGDVGCALSACLDVILEALPDSKLDPVEQILYVLDLSRTDAYEIVGPGAERRLDDATSADWGRVADILLARLGAQTRSRDSSDTSARCGHSVLLHQTLRALRAGGRREEAERLEIQHAVRTGDFFVLVARVMEENRHDDAEHLALQAVRQSRHPEPFRDRLRTLAIARKDWKLALAYGADAFLTRPSVDSFATLIEDAARARKKIKVRQAMLRFLETGTLADAARHDLLDPLPADARRDYQNSKPRPSILLGLALAENRPNDVIKWYDAAASSPSTRWDFHVDDAAVARSISKTHPRRAIEIYEDLAAAEIAHVNPSAYEVAARHLRKAMTIYKRLGRSSDWKAKIAAIRETHGRKYRLMEVLDGLEGRPIARRTRR